MVIHSKLQHHVTNPSHDATTYMECLPLYRKKERNKVLQYLCTSNDESAASHLIYIYLHLWIDFKNIALDRQKCNERKRSNLF